MIGCYIRALYDSQSVGVKASCYDDADCLVEGSAHTQTEFVGVPVEGADGLRGEVRVLHETYCTSHTLHLAILILHLPLGWVVATHTRTSAIGYKFYCRGVSNHMYQLLFTSSAATHYFHRHREPLPPAVMNKSRFCGRCLVSHIVDLCAYTQYMNNYIALPTACAGLAIDKRAKYLTVTFSETLANPSVGCWVLMSKT